MTAEEIYNKLQEKIGEHVLESDAGALDPWIKIKPESTFDVCQYLREDPALDFASLMCLSGLDYGGESDLGVVYNLFSIQHNHKITIRVDLPRATPKVPSVETIWRTADWHEREAYDLYGIEFEGHRDLRRILCPDDWEGYPMRKDYIVQEYYHGIRVPYQEDWDKYETFERNPERGHFVFKYEDKAPHVLENNGEKKNEENPPE